MSLAVSAVDELHQQGDTKGDLYEYMLSKLATAGIGGQFRTRQIIRAMVVTDPKPHETIYDPACGTAISSPWSTSWKNIPEQIHETLPPAKTLPW